MHWEFEPPKTMVHDAFMVILLIVLLRQLFGR